MDTNNNNNMQQTGMNGAPKGSGKGLWIAIIVLIIIVLAIMFMGKKKDDTMMPAPADNTSETTPETPVQGGGSTGVNEEPTTSPAATLSYTNALKQYAGKMLQFDGGCQVVPTTSPIYKAGTSIMLDNRSSIARTVKIGSSSYAIGSYGFRIATLNTEGTYKVDCGTSQNVTTLTVVK